MWHSFDAFIVTVDQVHYNNGALDFAKLSLCQDVLENSFSEKNCKKLPRKAKKPQNSISFFVAIIGCTSDNLRKDSSEIVFQELLQIFP